MFLTYFLPIGSMTFTYARVGVELWGSQSIGECTQRQLDNIKSKRRVSTYIMYTNKQTNPSHFNIYLCQNMNSPSYTNTYIFLYTNILCSSYVRKKGKKMKMCLKEYYLELDFIFIYT